jgi:hypothetical protein
MADARQKVTLGFVCDFCSFLGHHQRLLGLAMLKRFPPACGLFAAKRCLYLSKCGTA